MAIGQRLLGGGDDVLGRREVRLADAEVDDVPALKGELVGTGQHLEGTFGAEPVHAFREDHSCLPVRAFASFLRRVRAHAHHSASGAIGQRADAATERDGGSIVC